VSGPLSHLRILDLSRVLAGPWASQVLADLGAEVIKVERPGSGDDTRAWGPPWAPDQAGRATGESAYFLSANRGKKSVTIDISQADGQALVRALAARSDVVLENFMVGALSRYRLGWDDLRPVNPRLVYCSITGFGQTGPYRDRPGYDVLLQAMGGLMSVTGQPDGSPGGGPVKVGVALVDVLTGMYASTAVLAALAHRDRSGQGQHIDLALLDVQVAALANQATAYLCTGTAPARLGNAHPSIVPYQAFAARDGQLVVAVGNDGQFARLCAVLEQPALAEDPRFATNAARVANREALVPILAAGLARRDVRDWVGALEAAGVPCGPVNDLAAVFDDPQVRHRGLRIDLPHARAGMVPLVRSPIRLSGTPVEHGTAPPLLGQDTEAVLRDLLEIPDAERQRLRSAGVI
jgi:crotonobetainyl-CoA:carnitine CoA-transferase CaiB-like acyl-CoA transferase